MGKNQNLPTALGGYETSNGAINETLDANTLRALQDLKANVIKNPDGNIEVNFRDTSITKELQRTKMDSLAKILLQENYDVQQQKAVTDLIHDDPKGVGIVLDNQIFRTRVTEGDKIVYRPNDQAIQDFRIKFFEQLRDKPGLLKYENNDTRKLDLAPLHNPDTQLCYIEAFQYAFINFLKSKYGFSDGYATNVMNAMINYYSGSNVRVGNLDSTTPVVTENNDLYRQMVVNTIEQEFMSKSKFEALTTDKKWSDQIDKKGIIPGTTQKINDMMVNGYNSAYNQLTGQHLTDDQKISLGKMNTIFGTLGGVGLSYAAFVALRKKIGEKKSFSEKLWTFTKALVIPTALVGGGVAVYKNLNPQDSRRAGELLFGPKVDVNRLDSRNLSRRDLNNNIFKDFTPKELEKYFNAPIEYAVNSKYGSGDFNMDAFIEDYRKKVGPNPTSEQKQYINDMTIVGQYSPSEINGHIIGQLSTLGITYNKDNNGKVSFSGSSLDQKIGERILLDNNIETSRQILQTALEGAKTSLEQKSYDPVKETQKSNDLETLKFNISNMISELNVARNSSYITGQNDFVDAKNYSNGRFDRNLFMKKLGNFSSIADDENQILQQVAGGLTIAA